MLGGSPRISFVLAKRNIAEVPSMLPRFAGRPAHATSIRIRARSKHTTV